jgi:hypothetical protein
VAGPAPEDLALVLSVEPDEAAVQKAVGDIAKTFDAETAKIGEKWFETIEPLIEKQIKATKLHESVAKAIQPAKGAGKGGAEGGGGEDNGDKGFLSRILGATASAGKEGGSLGGMIGGALGGPPGAAIGAAVGAVSTALAKGVMAAVKELPALIGQTLAAPAQFAVAALGGLSHSLKELQGPLGVIGVGFDALTSGLETTSGIIKSIPILGSVLGPISETLAGIPGIFKEITTTLVDFAGKASPGTFKIWTEALEDTQAVIGRAFVPVLELMTEGAQAFGDVLANILPDMSEARSAFSEAREAMAALRAELGKTLADVGPQIRQYLIDGLRQVAHWIAVVFKVIQEYIARIRAYFGGSQSITGGAKGDAGGGKGSEGDKALRSAMGAAATRANIGGIEDYERQLQQAAFGAGTGGLSKEDQQLEHLKKIGDVDEDAKKLLGSIDQTFTKAKGVYDSVATQISSIVTSASNMAVSLSAIATATGSILKWLSDSTAGKLKQIQDEKARGAVLDAKLAQTQYGGKPNYGAGGKFNLAPNSQGDSGSFWGTKNPWSFSNPDAMK